MSTVQQAYRGRWRNVCGAPTDEARMADYVARAVARDGYQSFRIGDAESDGEQGAPERPVRAFLPLPETEQREWLDLVHRQAGEGEPLSDDERRRMTQLLGMMEGEVIGASDDHHVAMAMRKAHRDASA